MPTCARAARRWCCAAATAWRRCRRWSNRSAPRRCTGTARHRCAELQWQPAVRTLGHRDPARPTVQGIHSVLAQRTQPLAPAGADGRIEGTDSARGRQPCAG
ncbi:hypothetical protein G6F62_015161 [Rhizopus arrhizus]|nr:hypothetical protein G6F62_015161 [Rhizopus arrhizus]